MLPQNKASVLFPAVILIYLSLSVSSALQIPFIKRNSSFRAKRTLSVCDPDAVCGTVQLTSRGMTAMPMCTCPDPAEECPSVWDLTDSRSVVQGPVQYKHCKSTPPRHLSPCLPDQVAYTMRIMTPWSEVEDDPAVDAAMKISHRIHCICPDTHQHIQQGENLERIPFVGEIKTYSLTCAPYPTCGPDSPCKTLSETKTQFMENEVCRCAPGAHCPVTGNHRAKSFDFGVGKITQLFCQQQ